MEKIVYAVFTDAFEVGSLIAVVETKEEAKHIMDELEKGCNDCECIEIQLGMPKAYK